MSWDCYDIFLDSCSRDINFLVLQPRRDGFHCVRAVKYEFGLFCCLLGSTVSAGQFVGVVTPHGWSWIASAWSNMTLDYLGVFLVPHCRDVDFYVV